MQEALQQSAADTTATLLGWAEATPRRVTIEIPDEKFREFANHRRGQLLTALGYFQAYLFHGDFTDVLVYANGEDIEAYFTDERNPAHRFLMGAVWHEDGRKYTFHS